MKTQGMESAAPYVDRGAEAEGMESGEAAALGKYTRSFGASFAVTSILSSILVIEKALSKGLFEWMKAATSHHWITHGLFDMLVFGLLGLALAQTNGGTGVRLSTEMLTKVIVRSVIISCALIAGFYLIQL